MNGGEMMVVLIVAVMVIGKIIRSGAWPHRNVQADAAPRIVDTAENQQLREEIRQLKSRVATLERIATDSSASLDREIESLRDRP
jgi:hypothetical protein